MEETINWNKQGFENCVATMQSMEDIVFNSDQKALFKYHITEHLTPDVENGVNHRNRTVLTISIEVDQKEEKE